MHLRYHRLIALSLSLSAAACGPSPVPLVPSWKTPAAEGVVKAAVTDQGNTRLSIRVKHLARPGRVDPDARTYVVWVSKNRTPPQNVGALIVSDDLSGKLETVTPLRGPFVTITAEANPAAMVPRGTAVLTAKVPE